MPHAYFPRLSMTVFITVLMFTTFSTNADNSAPVIGFIGEFSPTTWNEATIPSGLVDSSKAPVSITIGNPPYFKLPQTYWSTAFYSHTAPVKGTLNFSFSLTMPSPSVRTILKAQAHKQASSLSI